MVLTVLLLFISLTPTGNCQCTQQTVDHINNMGTTWTAQTNFPGLSLDQMPPVCGTMNPGSMTMREVELMATIPLEFDAGTEWSQCQTIKSIYNQGNCDSCWAFSTLGAMSDRICINGLGNNVALSAQNLVTCCGYQQHNVAICDTATLDIPFECWKNDGIVTEGCQPYTLEEGGTSAQCSKTCVSGYSKSYSDDLYYGKDYYLIPTNETSMQSEIMRNGSITVGFEIYADVYCYGSGVYQHVTGRFLGYHAVKMIGWGVENGVPYWLLANSFGTEWGALGGFFKIRRGVNAVGIESTMAIAGIAGAPSLKDFQIFKMSLIMISIIAAIVAL